MQPLARVGALRKSIRIKPVNTEMVILTLYCKQRSLVVLLIWRLQTETGFNRPCTDDCKHIIIYFLNTHTSKYCSSLICNET